MATRLLIKTFPVNYLFYKESLFEESHLIQVLILKRIFPNCMLILGMSLFVEISNYQSQTATFFWLCYTLL